MRLRDWLAAVIVLALVACQREQPPDNVLPPRLDPEVPAHAVLALLTHVAPADEQLVLRVVGWEMQPTGPNCDPDASPCSRFFQAISTLPPAWTDALAAAGYDLVADSALVQERSYYAIIDSASVVRQGEYLITLGHAPLDTGHSVEYRVSCSSGSCTVIGAEGWGVSDYIVQPGAVRVGALRWMLFGDGPPPDWWN